jgi:hypothetical protein
MSADFMKLAVPLLIAVLVVFALYRRVRGSLGRQPLRSRAIAMRAALLGLVCGVLLLSPLMTILDVAYAAAGVLFGVGFAAYALRHTRCEITAKGIFYTGHPYIGLAVTALLIGRVFYRIVQVYPAIAGAGALRPSSPIVGQNPFAPFFSSPTTLAVYFLMAGYYIFYGLGILAKARGLRLADESQPSKPGNQ